MLVVCFSLIVLCTRLLCSLSGMHKHQLVVQMLFAYHFQTADDTYVIFLELLAQIILSPFLLLLQLQKTNSHPYFVYLCLFVVSPQQLLNPLAQFNHILQRKVKG